MDVEQIQKINNLALELMKQGLAADRESAIAQAERIFKEGNNSGYTAMRETMGEIKQDRAPAPAEPSAPAPALPADKINEILQKNTNYIVKTLRDFQEKMNNLEKQMEALKTQMKYQKLPTVKDIVSQKSQPAPAPQAAAPASPAQPSSENGKSHPRSGNYKEDDVSIEKFFYMGSK